MIKYRYTEGNTTTETLNLSDIPEGIAYETIEFEVQEEVEQNTDLLKAQAHELLKQTDWYVVRLMETGKPIPEEILQQRAEIRNSY